MLHARSAGSLRIEADLVGRGLPERLVAEAVDTSRAGEPEREWARRALGERRDRDRAWRFLAARGFSEDVIADLLGEGA